MRLLLICCLCSMFLGMWLMWKVGLRWYVYHNKKLIEINDEYQAASAIFTQRPQPQQRPPLQLQQRNNNCEAMMRGMRRSLSGR